MIAAKGAAVVIVNQGRVLAISRGLDRTKLTFPGGGTDRADRNPRETAARELFEETGVVVEPGHLQYVDQNNGFVVYTPMNIRSWPNELRSTPFEGFVGWHEPYELLSSRHGAFQGRVLQKVL